MTAEQVYQKRFYKIFEDTEPIEDINAKNDDIVCYEVASRTEFDPPQPIWRPLPTDQRHWHTARVLARREFTLSD